MEKEPKKYEDVSMYFALTDKQGNYVTPAGSKEPTTKVMGEAANFYYNKENKSVELDDQKFAGKPFGPYTQEQVCQHCDPDPLHTEGCFGTKCKCVQGWGGDDCRTKDGPEPTAPLSDASIAGIVIGSVAFIALVALFVFLYKTKKFPFHKTKPTAAFGFKFY
jgi:hypothetical protein